jgi:hypothetical protein
MSQQEQQDQYDLSRLLKKPSTKPSTKKKKVSLPTPVQAGPLPKLQLPVAPAFVLQHSPQPQLQTSFLAKPLHIQQQERLRKQQQEQKAQKQREQIALLRDFVSGYVDFSAVQPISKQAILTFVKTFKPDVVQQSTKDELVKLIKSERRRFLRNQSQIQRRQRLATIVPPTQKQLQQQQHLARLHDYLKGFDHDSVLNPISKQTLMKFVRSFNTDVTQQLSRQQLINLIDNQKKRLLQLQWQQQS